MTTVLVTGGAGYIGAFACRALLAAGHAVAVFDDFSRGDRARLPPTCTIEPSAAGIAAALTHTRPDAVVHLAGSLGGRRGDGEAHRRQNVAGMAALIDGLRSHGPNRLVFISSSAVYGAPANSLVAETAPLRPLNDYGASKLAAEQLCAEWARETDARALILRPANVAGAADALGWLPGDPTILPAALRAALEQAPLALNASRHPTPDGTAIRDFLHVADLAEAIAAAVRLLLAAEPPLLETLNIGSGTGVSLRELLAAVEHTTVRPLTLVPGPATPEPPRILLDPTRARRLLGFQPSRSDLATLVGSAWSWCRDAPAERR